MVLFWATYTESTILLRIISLTEAKNISFTEAKIMFLREIFVFFSKSNQRGQHFHAGLWGGKDFEQKKRHGREILRIDSGAYKKPPGTGSCFNDGGAPLEEGARRFVAPPVCPYWYTILRIRWLEESATYTLIRERFLTLLVDYSSTILTS